MFKCRSSNFTFSLPEQELLGIYRTPITKVYFLLQLAYFKFKQQFFIFDIQLVPKDIAYLQEAYFPKQELPTRGIISKPRRLSQQKVILDLMNYQMADEIVRQQLLDRACHLATLFARPIFIFRDLMNWAEQKRIVLPKYSVMQRHIIGRSITLERKRLEGIVNQKLSEKYQKRLEWLITKKIANGMYELTWLTQEVPNFKPQSLREETKRKEKLKALYSTAKSLISQFEIANENIRYYASLANHYTIGELKQFKGGMAYVFIVCYIQYRYQQINDVLVEAFKYYVRKYESQVKQMIKEYFYKYQLDIQEQLQRVPEILTLFINDAITDDTPFSVVRAQVFYLINRLARL